MSYETRAYDNEHGDPVVVLVATGTHDVSRLVHFLCGASPNSEQMRVGNIIKAQVKRHNGGRAALRLLAAHGGPDFVDDDHPGLDRFCDWPGCWAYTHAVNGPWKGWNKSRRYLLCPEHAATAHWADYTTDADGRVTAMTTTSRTEHVEWAKERALQELDAAPHGNGPANALTSLISDLRKHPETRSHSGIELTMMLAAGGLLVTPRDVREHIEGFR